MSSADGGPAFPSSPTLNGNGDMARPADIGCEGMTLRDYFAAKAMHAQCADPDCLSSCATIAVFSYEMADAMLAERVKFNS